MTTGNKKTAPEGATSETANELANGSTVTAYMAVPSENTRHTYGTWGGTDLPIKDHLLVVIPFEDARRMANTGPQLVRLNPACVAAQFRSVQKQREEQAKEQREKRRAEIANRLEAEERAELDALDAQFDRIYDRINARADELLAQEEEGDK